jgi:hypothetical protein
MVKTDKKELFSEISSRSGVRLSFASGYGKGKVTSGKEGDLLAVAQQILDQRGMEEGILE